MKASRELLNFQEVHGRGHSLGEDEPRSAQTLHELTLLGLMLIALAEVGAYVVVRSMHVYLRLATAPATPGSHLPACRSLALALKASSWVDFRFSGIEAA